MKDRNILMIDLVGQYEKIKDQINQSIIKSLHDGKYINGPIVTEFSNNLSKYLNIKHVIPCANGTDALQAAYMALDLKPVMKSYVHHGHIYRLLKQHHFWVLKLFFVMLIQIHLMFPINLLNL